MKNKNGKNNIPKTQNTTTEPHLATNRPAMDISGRYTQDYLARQEDDGYHQNHLSPEDHISPSDPTAVTGVSERTDGDICDEVYVALEQHPDVDARTVDVDVHDGVCTLSGLISSQQMKRQAEDCCRMVSGIHTVRNRLQVGLQKEGISSKPTH